MSIPKTTQNPWVRMANSEGPDGPIFPHPQLKSSTDKLEPIPEIDETSQEKTTKPSTSSELGTPKENPNND